MAKGQGLAALGLAALTAALIGTGLSITGGPAQGRAEKRDAMRAEDLRTLSANINCQSTALEGAMPSAPQKTDSCAQDITLTDPFTGTPYRFEPINDRQYRLCATFETEQITPRYGLLQRDGDCVIGSLPRQEPSSVPAPTAPPIVLR